MLSILIVQFSILIKKNMFLNIFKNLNKKKTFFILRFMKIKG